MLPALTSASWMFDAKCRVAQGVNFYPAQGEPTAPALAVCRSCPVREQCLEYALAANETFGIWGGVSADRRAVLRRRGLARPRRREIVDPVGCDSDDEQMTVVEGASNGRADHAVVGTGPTCEICGEPLDDDRVAAHAKTCSAEDCKTEHDRRRRRASYARSRNGSAPVTPVTPAVPLLAAGPLWAAVAAAGTVTRLDINVAGECWTLTRTISKES
jgi:WhiB family redox-sensing transcriptional regulator